MPSCRQGTQVASTYQYRADGMRVEKTVLGISTRYRFAGQMGIEDKDTHGNVRQCGLGRRGITMDNLGLEIWVYAAGNLDNI